MMSPIVVLRKRTQPIKNARDFSQRVRKVLLSMATKNGGRRCIGGAVSKAIASHSRRVAYAIIQPSYTDSKEIDT